MNVNTILIFILIIILSLGGYFILTQNRISENRLKYFSKITSKPEKSQNIKIKPIVIPKKSIEFSIFKNNNNEYTFLGVFSKEDTPKLLVKDLDIRNLQHDIYINHELKYDKNVIFLVKKLLKELVDNYVEGSIVYKKKKLLISGSVKDEKDIDTIDNILAYSSVNSFNSTQVYSTLLKEDTDINSETVDIISNLVRTVDNGEDTISELLKPKVITKEKIVIKYKEPKVIIKEKIVIKYKEPKVIIKEKIVIKKEPVIKEKIVVKYVTVPAVNSQNDMTSKMTKDDYIRKLKSKGSDKSIISLPPVKTLDMNIEEKIKKGEIEALRTNKPLVKKETIYVPSSEKKIDKKIPWANLYEMDDKLNGVVYDDVVASPQN